MLCCVLFVFLLCLVCPMMLESLSLDCPFIVAPSIFSYVYYCYQHNKFLRSERLLQLVFYAQERGILTLRDTYLSHILSVSYVFDSFRTPKCHHLIGMLPLANKLGSMFITRGYRSEYKILVGL